MVRVSLTAFTNTELLTDDETDSPLKLIGLFNWYIVIQTQSRYSEIVLREIHRNHTNDNKKYIIHIN